MTLKRILLWIAAAGLLATACSEKEQQPEEETKPLVEPVMTLLSGEIPIFTDQGGETTVSFSSTCPWKVTSSAKWVVITPSSGEAGEELEVNVKVLASNVYEQRHSTLTFSCSNGKEDDSATLEILQKQEGALIVSPSSIIVKSAGGTVSINVKASYEVSFEILGESAREWIIPVEESKVYVPC